METDRNFTFLGSLDLKKFTLSENKKHIQATTSFDQRPFQQRPFLTQLDFIFPVASETLIAHVEVDLKDANQFDAIFEGFEIEASSLNSRGHFLQLVNWNLEKNSERIVCTGYAFTHVLKIGLQVKGEWKKKVGRSSKDIQQGLEKGLKQAISDVNIYGISINSNPSPILLTKLLNVSQSFKKYNLLHEAAETDMLTALSLISARRFVQASELLRKISQFYVGKYGSSRIAVDFNRTERSWITRDAEDDSNTRNNFASGRIIEGNKFLQKAAKIELLLAETISHPSLVNEKLEAYNRCNAYSLGNCEPESLRPDVDMEGFSVAVFPQLAPFLLKMLSDKLEPVRVAALKSIQFFIETLGCTINSIFLQILKEVIATYPVNSEGDPNFNHTPYGIIDYGMTSDSKNTNFESSQLSVKNKILIDPYHHLLETLLSLMGQINKRMMLPIFAEIVAPGILSKQTGSELKLYLLRFAEKAISISGADLNIEVSFIGLLLNFCEQKNSSKGLPSLEKAKGSRQDHPSTNKHTIYNLAIFSSKILTLIRTKVLPRYSGARLEPYLAWINKTLNYLGENQLLSNSSQSLTSLFSVVLELIMAIYSVQKLDPVKLKSNPIESILYFTNMAVHQNGLPFEQILDCLIVLLRYLLCFDSGCDIDKQIATRVLQKSKENNLSLKELQVLGKVLSASRDNECMLEWLQIFLGSIPHSTFDETYWVFSILIQKSASDLHSNPAKSSILRKIVKTLLDQYTVKGKAHQQAKETLIVCLSQSNDSNIIDLLAVCLFDNNEPKPESYYKKLKSKALRPKEHNFDSKSYKIDKEMFIEKVSFAQLIMSKIVSDPAVHQRLLQPSIVESFTNSLVKLAGSSNWKLKNKSLSLMNYFIQISAHYWKSLVPQDFFHYAQLIRAQFALSKIFFQTLKDSKLIYSILYNLMSMFKSYDPQDPQRLTDQSFDRMNDLSKMSGSEQIKDKNTQSLIKLFLLKQFIKAWPQLSLLSYSPWQNVREIYNLLLQEVFKDGITYLPQALRKKTAEIAKSLLNGLFSSSEHSDRQGALKTLGCLLGLRVPETKVRNMEEIITQNLKFLSPISEKVYQMTYDWDETTSEIAEYLSQLCFSREGRQALRKRAQMEKKVQSNLDGSFCSFNLGEEMTFQKKLQPAPSANLETLLMKDSWCFDEELPSAEAPFKAEINEFLFNKILEFRTIIEKDIQNRTEIFGQKESFLEPNDEFYDLGEERAESVEAKDSRSEQEQLEFEDLGIIELDDEEWGDQDEKEEKITQKLPLKKIYKLSPSVINSSKPQRIRSKRYHQNEFDYSENIIVDELESGKIDSTLNHQQTRRKDPPEESAVVRQLRERPQEKREKPQERRERPQERREKYEQPVSLTRLPEQVMARPSETKLTDQMEIFEGDMLVREGESEKKEPISSSQIPWMSNSLAPKKKKTSKKRKSSLGK